MRNETHELTTDEDKPRSLRFRWIAAGILSVGLIAGACSASPEGGEHGSSGEGTESRDGSGSGEAAEGGVVNLLAPDQTYDEVRNGARLVLSYDAAANTFTGTVENTTTGTLTRARVEIHLSNGVELGPTTPVDLAPGEIVVVSLPATDAPFGTWSAHPEVGAGEGTESGGEGSEGSSEAGAQTPRTSIHLTSTGVSRGVQTTLVLAEAESYAGKLNGLEIAITFDPASDSFIGRVKNEAPEGLCNTTISVILDGNRSAHQSVLVPSLDVGGRADFTLDAGPNGFTTWEAETDTFTCTSVVSEAGEGGESGSGESGTETSGEGGSEGSEGTGEGSGEHGSGGESSGEHGSEGSGESGGESGAESNSAIPVDQVATGTFNSLDFYIAYDPTTNAFRGVVTNNTNQTVCGSRLEIHMSANGQVIELGPTIGLDLAPGETLDVVLSTAPITPDTYSLHPESSPCP